MMDFNVGDMPLDIFGDYVSDLLGIEFNWEYFGVILNGLFYGFKYGDSLSELYPPLTLYGVNNSCYGNGHSYDLENISYCGNGRSSLNTGDNN
jgi:hypothetical protein